MIHYHVWFSIKDTATEFRGLALVRGFLTELFAAGGIDGFRILKNSGSAGRTRMLPFHALIELRGAAQFPAVFSKRAARGIHTGLHGRVMKVAADFQIEMFREIETPAAEEHFLMEGA